MTDKNEVEGFSVTTKLEGGRHHIVKGDKVPNAKLFFNFLHEKNICFKIFFNEYAYPKGTSKKNVHHLEKYIKKFI